MEKNRQPARVRNVNIDIVRCCAFFLVVSVHFLLNLGIYSEPVRGWRMFVMVTMRGMFVNCIPLFLLVTGYVQNHSRLTLKYFRKIIPVYSVYVAAAAANIIFSFIRGSDNRGVFTLVREILDFSGAKYAWYIEMYLGLFLMIPFLNLAYHGLESRRKKMLLILVMVILTILPPALNIFRFTPLSWWRNPASDREYHQLVPGWWAGIYPITYYFVGCFLAEYPVRARKGKTIAAMVLTGLCAGAFSYWRSYGSRFISGDWANYRSPFTFIQGILIFILIMNIDFSWISRKGQERIRKISSLGLGAYLLSSIPDKLVYPWLQSVVENPQERLKWYFVCVPIVYFSSLLLSWLLTPLAGLVGRLIGIVFDWLSGRAERKMNET